MMRYFARPRSYYRPIYVEDDTYDSQKAMLPSLTVDDHEAVNTGLLDKNGDDIWRGCNPMGFGHDQEW